MAVVFVTTACLGPLIPLALRANTGLTGADLSALRFTLVQATLSAVLSVALAVPLARALARARFAGRGAVIALLGAPFILPVIVAVFGLIALFGRGGLINAALAVLGLPPVSIYGLSGVVLAHVFLNLPLATRLILLGWQAVPADRFRLAATLNLPVGLVIERPVLRATLPGALLAVFLICLSSFAVALTLGGGPAATTLELAIYQALRFDFAPGRAAVLALVQLGLCLAAALLALRVLQTMHGGGQDAPRWDRSRWDAPVIGAALLFIGLPIGLVVWRGLGGLPDLPAATWPALARSLIVAAGATAVSLTLALLLASGKRTAGVAAMLPLSVSGMALGAGILIVAASVVQVADLALPVAGLFGGILALPFAYRALAPALDGIRARHDRLVATLALPRVARWRIVYLPLLRAPLGLAAGLTAALSIGDLGMIALFAGAQEETLPLLLQRLMGAYRTDAAAGVALVLMATALGLFALCDRWGRR